MGTVKETGGVLQTGSMQRSMPEFRIASELIRNGVIGKISHVDCSFGGPGRPCDLPKEAMESALDWDMWVGPAKMRPYNSILSPRGVHKNWPNWRAYKEFGSGMVGDWGAHHLDIKGGSWETCVLCVTAIKIRKLVIHFVFAVLNCCLLLMLLTHLALHNDELLSETNAFSRINLNLGWILALKSWASI